jgi:arylsulfatase A-like enzyme
VSERPNIVLITAHDLGRHIGCEGIQTVHTPHLDRLAQEGVRFSRAFCTAPQCSPSRASIATGRYPHNNGVMGLTSVAQGWELHEEERHLAGLLAEEGYHTARAGVVHETRRAAACGFSEQVTGVRTGHHGDPPRVAGGAVARWLEEDAPRERPFYLQMGFFETHRFGWLGFGHGIDAAKGVTVPPYLQEEISARQEFAAFQADVRAFDEGVGQILDGLDRAGLREQTLLVVTTDHGIPFPRAKCTLYDSGLETFLLMRWPNGGFVGPGASIDGLVSNIDLAPTLLECAGATPPTGMQGESLGPVLRGASSVRRTRIFGELTYHAYCDPCRCVRSEDHKLIANFTVAPSFMDASQQWRPSTIPRTPANPPFAKHPDVELYDLRADPHEQENLASSEQHQSTRDALMAELYDWMVETDDPLLYGIPTPPSHTRTLSALREAKPG